MPRVPHNRPETHLPGPRPPLCQLSILAWADAHFARTGSWPTQASGPILEAPGENWKGVDTALRRGLRGLPAGSSAARLLARHRGKPNPKARPALDVARILAWADAHHRRTGMWPHVSSGPIPEAQPETWQRVDHALRRGMRGLPGGSSLFALLGGWRGVSQWTKRPPLTTDQILAWADAHHRRTGRWPTPRSGRVRGTAGETWQAIHWALQKGHRSLPPGTGLPRFLAARRGARNCRRPPRLSLWQVLAWADEHHGRTGKWPNVHSGPVHAAPEETWKAIDWAFRKGSRGLPGGWTLAIFLGAQRGLANGIYRPPLRRAQILQWADAHHRRTGSWPSQISGTIAGAPGETWGAVDAALRHGRRGLPGGSSLSLLLAQHRK